MNNDIEIVTAEITNKIMAIPESKRMFAGFVKLQHHDGSIVMGLGVISEYKRTLCAANVTTWYNRVLSKKRVKEQVQSFVEQCQSRGLPLQFQTV